MDAPLLPSKPAKDAVPAQHARKKALPPVESYSWASQFLFTYMTAVFDTAVKAKRLTFRDIHAAGKDDDPLLSFSSFFKRQRMRMTALPRIRSILRGGLLARWLYAGFLLLISTAGGLGLPLLINYTLMFLDSDEAQFGSSTRWKGYVWASGIFFAAVLQAVTIHKFWWEASRTGLHSQFSLTTALLLKTLQLSPAAKIALGLSKGKLLNLMSSDACKPNDQFLFCTLHWQSWSAAITVGVALFYLYELLGVAGIAGAVAMVVFVPLISVLTRLTRNLTVKVQKKRDARGKIVAELIAGITTLKVYRWESHALGQVFNARQQEMVAIRRRQLLGVCTDAISSACPVLILAITFGLYAFLNPDKPLTAAQAFSAVSWIATLQFPLRSIPYFIATAVDCGTSLDRLKKVMAAPDADVSTMSQWEQQQQHMKQPAEGEAQGKEATRPSQAVVPLKDWLQVTADNKLEAAPGRSNDARTTMTTMLTTSLTTGSIDVSGACFAHPVGGEEDEDEDKGKEEQGKDKEGGAGKTAAPAAASLSSISTCDHCASAVATFNAEALRAAIKRQEEENEKSSKKKESKKKKDSAKEDAKEGKGKDEMKAMEWRPVLHHLDFSCRPGTVTLAVGAVGSGKSSLLSGLIGEAFLLTGKATVTGRIAFAAQQPWILSKTVKENVLFFSEYRQAWYRTVIKACCLEEDIASFAKKDQQTIGDAGITLSGGQKARLALARAVYSDADVFLLDDVLGAVDAVIAARIWDACIVNLLLKRGKTVLMATHAVHFCRRPEVAQVIVLSSDGRMMVPAASYSQVIAAASSAGGGGEGRGGAGGEESPKAKAVRAVLAAELSAGDDGAADAAAISTPNPAMNPGLAVDAETSSAVAFSGLLSTAAASSPSVLSSSVVATGVANAEEGAVPYASKIQEDEDNDDDGEGSVEGEEAGEEDNAPDGLERYARGSVQRKHILRYIKAMGSPLFLFGLLAPLYLLSQVVTVSISWVMALWVGSGGGGGSGGNTPSQSSFSPPTPSGLLGGGITVNSAVFWALIYASLNVALALLNFFRALALTFGALRAGSKVHDAAITGVTQAPSSFFSANPAGRILNRFLSDQSTIDDTVRLSLSQMAQLVFSFLGTIIVVSYFAPYTLLIVASLSWVYWLIAKGYRFSARDLRRMQSVSKSPIFQSFGELCRGTATIRAFGPKAACYFLQQHLDKTRQYGRAFMALWSANEFISTWAEGVGCLVVLGSSLLGVWAHQSGKISTADVGLLLSFVLQLPSTLMWAIRYWTQIEIDAVAIERLVEYASLPSEEAACVLPRASEGTAGLALSSSPAFADGVSFEKIKMAYLPFKDNSEDSAADGHAKTSESRDAKGEETALIVPLSPASVPRSPQAPPLILKDFILHLPRGKKLAITGKTGGGKSTSTQALLRLYPFQEGRLCVNGVDLSTASIQQARSMVTALLQDGFLFSGTIRENLLGPHLKRKETEVAKKGKKKKAVSIKSAKTAASSWEVHDPTAAANAVPISINVAQEDTTDAAAPYLPLAATAHEADISIATAATTPSITDGDLWQVLRLVSMDATVRALPEGLDAPITEGGGNLSVGEKALLTLARALLHRKINGTTVFVADEPSASVDVVSDRVVHETLLGLDDTLICICHRLHFVPRFDLVAVVEDGRIAEVGPPAVLMANPSSRYRFLQDSAAASGSVWRAAAAATTDTSSGAGAGSAAVEAPSSSR